MCTEACAHRVKAGPLGPLLLLLHAVDEQAWGRQEASHGHVRAYLQASPLLSRKAACETESAIFPRAPPPWPLSSWRTPAPGACSAPGLPQVPQGASPQRCAQQPPPRRPRATSTLSLPLVASHCVRRPRWRGPASERRKCTTQTGRRAPRPAHPSTLPACRRCTSHPRQYRARPRGSPCHACMRCEAWGACSTPQAGSCTPHHHQNRFRVTGSRWPRRQHAERATARHASASRPRPSACGAALHPRSNQPS